MTPIVSCPVSSCPVASRLHRTPKNRHHDSLFARTSKLSHQPRAIYMYILPRSRISFSSQRSLPSGPASPSQNPSPRQIVQELNFQFMSDSKSERASESVNCSVEWHERSRQPNRDVDPAGRRSHAPAHSTRPCQCTESGYADLPAGISRMASPNPISGGTGILAIGRPKQQKKRKDLHTSNNSNESQRARRCGVASVSHSGHNNADVHHLLHSLKV